MPRLLTFEVDVPEEVVCFVWAVKTDCKAAAAPPEKKSAGQSSLLNHQSLLDVTHIFLVAVPYDGVVWYFAVLDPSCRHARWKSF